MSLEFTVVNQGDVDAGSFHVHVVLSDDDVIGNGDDVVLTSQSLVSLGAGQSETWNLNIQLDVPTLFVQALADDPPGQNAGYTSVNSQTLGIVIDPSNAIAEDDESNNFGLGKRIDQDDFTFFPWDRDNDGLVTSVDAIYAINRLGQTVDSTNELADFDGDGLITSTDAISAINRLGYEINGAVIPPLIGATLNNDTGVSESDGVTNDPAVTGSVSDANPIASFMASVDAADPNAFTDVISALQPDGSFTLDGAALELINGGPLADGDHTLRLQAADNFSNVSPVFELLFTLDTEQPLLTVDAPSSGNDITPGARLTGQADGTGSFLALVAYNLDGDLIMPVPLNGNGQFDVELDVIGKGEGALSLTVSATDVAGNEATTVIGMTLTGVPFEITSVTPLDSDFGVSARVHPRIDFSSAADPASITGANFFATAAGQALDANIVMDPNGLFARLFFTDPMPGATDVEVTVIGSSILSLDDGEALDADGDGVAGGELTFTFTTASMNPLPGTAITGRLADPGPDQIPLTADDTLPGPDGELGTEDDVILLPVSDATIFVRGLESDFVSSGGDGRFTLEPAPAGAVALAIHGEFASAPTGFTYSEMVPALSITAGITNDIGTMYLPRLPEEAVQQVNGSVDTVLTLPVEAAGGLTEEQRQQFTVQIAANSLLGPDGLPVSSAEFVMGLVPNDGIKSFLPSALSESMMAFTTQLRGGATDFAQPFQVTMPNTSGAPVGTEFSVMSFDAATGKLVRDTRAVVVAQETAESQTAVLQLGGLIAPASQSVQGADIISGGNSLLKWDIDLSRLTACFHVVTGPVSPVLGNGCDPSAVVPTEFVMPEFTHDDTFKDHYFASDSGSFNLHFENAAAMLVPNLLPCNPLNLKASPLEVEIELKQASSGKFIDGLKEKETFLLYPEEKRDIDVRMRSLLTPDNVDGQMNSRLYGAEIKLKGTYVNPQTGVRIGVFDQSLYVYRFWDIADGSRTDSTLGFERTLADGSGQVTRPKTVDGVMPDSAAPTIELNSEAFALNSNLPDSFEVVFDPDAPDDKVMGSIPVTSPNGEMVGALNLEGKAVSVTNIVFKRAQFIAELGEVADFDFAEWAQFQSIFPADSDSDGMRSDEAGFDAVANDIYDQIVAKVENPSYAFTPEIAAAVSVTPSGSGTQVNTELQLNDDDSLFLEQTGFAEAPRADFAEEAFFDMLDEEDSLSTAEEHFRFVSFVNQDPVDAADDFSYTGALLYMQKLVHRLRTTPNPVPQFVQSFTHAIAHEVGHSLGMIHTRNATHDYLLGDIMGKLGPVPQSFKQFASQFHGVVKAAVGVPFAPNEYIVSRDYYEKTLPLPPSVPGNLPENSDLVPKQLSVYALPVELNQAVPDLVTNVAFNQVIADGAGGQSQTVTVHLFNDGLESLTISDVTLDAGSAGFTIEGLTPLPLMLPAMDPDNPQPALSQQALTLRFDPSVAGDASDVLRIVSDQTDGLDVEILLTGSAISPFGDALVEVMNSNLSGVALSEGAVASAEVMTIRNVGAAALTINDISLTDSEGQFSLSGVPVGAIVLAPDETFTFGATFDAANLGLRRALVEIVTDDPDMPLISWHLSGTGLPDTGPMPEVGKDYVAVARLTGDPDTQRLISNANGNWNVFLPVSTPFRNAIFDPDSGLIHDTFGVTSASGETETPTPFFHASTAADSDGDGLPDDIEFAIGSDIEVVDTDSDGLDDFVEIALGFNPLDGVAGQVGIIGALQLNGDASDITVIDNLAYITTDGLSIVDVSDPTLPRLLGSRSLSGFPVSVSVDEALKLAAVAVDLVDPGLHIIDVSNPGQPLLQRTIPLVAGASHVETFDGYAFVASGTALVKIDMTTGDSLQTLDLGGAAIAGLAREGQNLFVMDLTGTLTSVGISDFQVSTRDSLAVTDGGGEIFAGGGIVYATARNAFRGGFATIDASDPDNLALLSGSDVASGFRPDFAVAADSGEQALVVGNAPDPMNPIVPMNVVDVFDVSDPTVTDAFLTRYELPASPTDLALANGVALIADGTGGLIVVGYQPADLGDVEPSVSLATINEDADAVAPGFQVIEGSFVHLIADATDDSLVRHVELLVNGSVVATDTSFPYEAIMDPGAAGGNLVVQARATDVGGNVTLSSALNLDVIADTIAPTIISVDPNDGASLPEGLQQVSVRFSEAIDPTSVTPANFQVVLGGSQVIAADSIALSSRDRLVELNFAGLSAGDYQFVINGPAVVDLAGNPLGPGDVVISFTLTGDAIEWTNPAGGFWDDPNNWEGGMLPGASDNVVINVAANVVITHRMDNTTVNRIVSTGSLAITGGTLEVTTTVQVDGEFTIGNGATLRGATVVPGASDNFHIAASDFANLDSLTLQTNLTIDDIGTASVINGMNLDNGRITLAATGGHTGVQFQGDATLGGTGEIFFGGTTTNPGDNSIDSDGILTIAPGITIRGDTSGSVGTSFGGQTIILQGTILADTASETIRFGGMNSQIQGLVHAAAGDIELQDTFSFDSGGTFRAEAGQVILDGTLDNTGKTLVINAMTGSLVSDGGTILGGRLEFADGATLVPQTTVTLDGVTLGSDLTIPDGTNVHVRNGLTLDNVTVTLQDGTVAFIPSRLRFLDSSTLGGTGDIFFGGTGDSNNLSGTTGFTFTIGPNITVHGTRGGSVGILGNLINQGTIAADTASRTITISGSSFNNQGTASATNGGRFTLSSTVTNDGLLLAGTGSTIRLLGSGAITQNSGETRLAGGTVQATTLSIQGGSLTGDGTVNGSVINASVVAPGSGGDPTGTINISSSYQQTGTGSLQIDLAGTASTDFDRLLITGNATLAGLLAVNVLNPFAPMLADVFTVLMYASLTDGFDLFSGLDLGGGLKLDVDEQATLTNLVVVPA